MQYDELVKENARLQAEVKRLDLEVSAYDYAHDALSRERDALKAELRKTNLTNQDFVSQIGDLQSELTKLGDDYCKRVDELTRAREALREIIGACGDKNSHGYISMLAEDALPNQSAPADQNSDWEDTFGPDYEVDENDLARGVSETDNLLPVRDGYCQCGRLVHRPQINQSAPADKGGDS